MTSSTRFMIKKVLGSDQQCKLNIFVVQALLKSYKIGCRNSPCKIGLLINGRRWRTIQQVIVCCKQSIV